MALYSSRESRGFMRGPGATIYASTHAANNIHFLQVRRIKSPSCVPPTSCLFRSLFRALFPSLSLLLAYCSLPLHIALVLFSRALFPANHLDAHQSRFYIYCVSLSFSRLCGSYCMFSSSSVITRFFHIFRSIPNALSARSSAAAFYRIELPYRMDLSECCRSAC